MNYCSQCELVHGEEHRFCQRCGQLLKGAAVSVGRPCPRCEGLTFPGQKFCTECGLPLRVAPAGRDEQVYQGQRPPLFYPRASRPAEAARSRRRRPFQALMLLSLVLVMGVGGYYGVKWLIRSTPGGIPTPGPGAEETLRREVERLAEKIRSSHLNKDIHKWLSCYDPNYPKLGILENQMLELWKNYDIKEVSYRISQLQRLNERQVQVLFVWSIQLYDHRTQDYTLDRPSYRVILEKANGDWKIKDSKVESGG
ncbi:MAG: hypothetical protein FJ128_00485 [Deltaproteobacteria bacterium]|nr:hypothetical protein [Deltaproteobacteria bacterium]